MKKNSLLWVCLLLVLLLGAGYSEPVHAQLCVNAIPGQGNDLKTNAQANMGGGVDIVQVIFSSVNGIMNNLAENFYTSIINNPNYRNAVSALVLLYIVVYGAMIMLNIASYRTGEIVNRLFKIAVLFAMISDGWTFFSLYIGDPIIRSMNQLIVQFGDAGGIATPAQAVNPANGGNLSPVSMQMLFGSMSLMFSIRFLIIILTMLGTGAFGWLYAFLLIWGLVEFILMLIGAIVTYIKAIVGLAFLFGLAPIFFSFILFEKTRQVFQGWLNQVMGFFLQPVLLFAFLGFYGSLLTSILVEIMFPPGVDFCWQTFFSLGLLDAKWWRAGPDGGGVGYDWDVSKSPPIQLLNILYFLLLVHLGKNLSEFIQQLSRDLSGGSGPGIVRGATVGQWFANNLSGGAGFGASTIGGVKAAGNAGVKGVVGVRKALDSFVAQAERNGGKDVSRVGEGYSSADTSESVSSSESRSANNVVPTYGTIGRGNKGGGGGSSSGGAPRAPSSGGGSTVQSSTRPMVDTDYSGTTVDVQASKTGETVPAPSSGGKGLSGGTLPVLPPSGGTGKK